MKRKLLKQIWNERRSNAWLVVELILVSSVLWAIADQVAPQIMMRARPAGVDVDNVYTVSLRQVGADSPYHRNVALADPSVSEFTAGGLRLFNLLEQLPEVEAVTSSAWGFPYTFNGRSGGIEFADTTVRIPLGQWGEDWEVMPNYFKVFKTTGIKGETPEELEKILESGKFIVTRDATEFEPEGTTEADRLYNMEIVNDTWERTGQAQTHTIGAVIPRVPKAGDTVLKDAYLVIKATSKENAVSKGQLFVRKRPDVTDARFQEIIRGISNEMKATGNVYISKCYSFERNRDIVQYSDDVKLRDMLVAMGFMLVTVFLGVFGTFWFRTQQRARELAIRKVTGADSGALVRRLIGEGLLMLAIATPFAMVIDWLMIDAGWGYTAEVWPWKYKPYCLAYAAVVFLLMAATVALSIWIPARRAMRVDPAETLRSE